MFLQSSIVLTRVRHRLRKTEILYIPVTDQKPAQWVAPKGCILAGPSCFENKTIVGVVPKYFGLHGFLIDVLEISRPTPEDVLACLASIKEEGDYPDQNNLCELYEYLYNEFRLDSDWSFLR